MPMTEVCRKHEISSPTYYRGSASTQGRTVSNLTHMRARLRGAGVASGRLPRTGAGVAS